jgi:hypothetical protein
VFCFEYWHHHDMWDYMYKTSAYQMTFLLHIGVAVHTSQLSKYVDLVKYVCVQFNKSM